MNNTKKGLISGIISILFLSTYSIFGKLLLKNLIPETLAALSQAISVVTLLLFLGLVPELKKLLKLKPKEKIWLFFMSISSAVIAPLFLLKGLEITSATNSVIIGRIEPVFAVIIACIWLKEKISSQQILGGILMFSGILFIITHGFETGISFNYGDILIVASAFTWAFSTNLFKKYLVHIEPELVVFSRNTIGAIILFFIIPYLFRINHDISMIVDYNVILTIVLFAIFTIISAQLLWYKTLELISAVTASSLGLLTPFFGVIMAVIILQEKIFSFHIIGGTFVLLGLGLTIICNNENHLHLLNKTKHWFH